MIAVPFKPEHLERLDVQPAQAAELAAISSQLAAALARHDAWTIADGAEVLLCGGIFEPQAGAGVLWAAVSAHVGARMIALTRVAKRYLALNSRRIETEVRVDFAAGCRWAELLGFKREGAEGADYFVYVRGS